MTKTKFYLQFFFIAAFFVLPPLFAPPLSNEEHALFVTGFSWWHTACLLAALFMNFFLGEFRDEIFRGNLFGKNKKIEKKSSQNFSAEKTDSLEGEFSRPRLFDSRGGFADFFSRRIFLDFSQDTGKFRRVIVIAEFLKTFGFLCASQAFFEFLGFLLKAPHYCDAIFFPENLAEFLSFPAAFLVAAFFEETLYRAYLPFSLKKIFCKKCWWQKKALNAENESAEKTDSVQNAKRAHFSDAAAEIVAIAIFGFSHLQNGMLAVANALVAGFFLRRCAVKTGGIKAGFFAHFFYNALTLAIITAFAS